MSFCLTLLVFILNIRWSKSYITVVYVSVHFPAKLVLTFLIPYNQQLEKG